MKVQRGEDHLIADSSNPAALRGAHRYVNIAGMTPMSFCGQVPSGGRCQLDGLLDVFATETGALDKAPETLHRCWSEMFS
ncbi:hypothetical protein QA640_46825 (plasmid) [Bradyrhizobium sp. CB82]|uniref:hypothetical protein n=1 Tax=Bradyrhizobium sp. CB82 TaxID=3039159 RepID=UPI0024B0F47F|nr:hypothetical protein [Bradyrhizobium sp. CB82]WFU45528.1 hypothetical protein QA640_46825 [Bradyrhizobium sp. CB82]